MVHNGVGGRSAGEAATIVGGEGWGEDWRDWSMALVCVYRQAVMKIMVERLITSEVVERSLGKVWCLIKGIVCKDLGENHFLITFLQSAGKQRALEDGPWMISKDLAMVMDFD